MRVPEDLVFHLLVEVEEIDPEDPGGLDGLVVFEEAMRKNGGVWTPRVGSYGMYYPGSDRQLLLEQEFMGGSR